jgi:ABC-type dipeptide/oligopeptide/nickel transport system permease component
VSSHDIPVLQGAVLLVGIVYMISTLLADVFIAFLNPRVRLEAS